jgi:hypothetical protein
MAFSVPLAFLSNLEFSEMRSIQVGGLDGIFGTASISEYVNPQH